MTRVNGADDDGDGFNDDVNGADFLNGDAEPNDDGGHGTHVAGIIGAQGNNSVGITGVNWEAQVMGLKFLDGNGEGNTADAANAIDFAVDHGARVINASWGGPSFSHALYSAIRRASEHGVLVVAAAGNDGVNADSSPDYPAAFDLPNVISVAATDRSDRLVDFSNYGAKSVDLAAPGDDVYSTVPSVSDPSGYAAFSGTSMAAPFVAGAAALYLSKYPQATVDQLRAALLGSVDQPADARGQDRHRRPAEPGEGARRGIAVHAAAARHDSAVHLLADPSPEPPRDPQARPAIRVAAVPRLERHPRLPAVRERQAGAHRARQGRPRRARPEAARALPAAWGQAPLVRAGLRLRRQPAHQPRVQALQELAQEQRAVRGKAQALGARERARDTARSGR